MTKIVLLQQAGEFEVYDRHAFDTIVGDPVPVDVNGKTIGTGVMTSAEVSEDGKSVTLTVELDDGQPDETIHAGYSPDVWASMAPPVRPRGDEARVADAEVKIWDELVSIVVRAIDQRRLSPAQRTEINLALLRVAGQDLGDAFHAAARASFVKPRQ